MSRTLRAVLFDLGGTLMQPRGPWEPVEARADRALTDSLRLSGLDLAPGFAEGFRWRLSRYYREREESLIETSYFTVLREMVAQHASGTVSDDRLRLALDALFAVTQQNWALDAEAIPTLQKLTSTGHRLGLVSNAGDDKDVKTLARRFKIEGFFDFILTSAACSFRKPHPRIFELALAHWGCLPEEAAMVGDTLDADILGAQRMGMFTIWLLNGKAASPSIQPDAAISRLSEIPALLASPA